MVLAISFDSWRIDNCISDYISIFLSNEPTCSISLDAIQILENGSRLLALYWIIAASINCSVPGEGDSSSGGGTDCGSDLSTDVDSSYIHCRSGCIDIHPDRLLEEAHSGI